MDPPSPNLPFTIVGTIRIRQRDAELALLRVAAAAGGYTPGEEDVGIPTVIFTSKKGGSPPTKNGAWISDSKLWSWAKWVFHWH